MSSVKMYREWADREFTRMFGENERELVDYVIRWKSVAIDNRNQRHLNIWIPEAWAAVPASQHAELYCENRGREANLPTSLQKPNRVVCYKVRTLSQLLRAIRCVKQYASGLDDSGAA